MRRCRGRRSSRAARAKNSAQVSAAFVGEDLGVREPAVVIDDGVDVVVADLGLLLDDVLADLSAVGPPAATVGDPADLLDVHVDQLAGTVTLVTHRGRLRGSDHLAGQRVALHRRGTSWRRRILDTVRAGTPSSAPSQSCPRRCSRRASSTRCSTSSLVRVGNVCGRELAIVQDRPRPRRRSGRPSDAHTDATSPSPWRHEQPASPRPDTMHQQTATMNGQTSVTVRHEDLRIVKRQTPQDPEVFTHVNPSPT